MVGIRKGIDFVLGTCGNWSIPILLELLCWEFKLMSSASSGTYWSKKLMNSLYYCSIFDQIKVNLGLEFILQFLVTFTNNQDKEDLCKSAPVYEW